MSKFSKTDEDRIRYFFENGEDCEEIAKRLGVKGEDVRTAISRMYGTATIREARKIVMRANYTKGKTLEVQAKKARVRTSSKIFL